MQQGKIQFCELRKLAMLDALVGICPQNQLELESADDD